MGHWCCNLVVLFTVFFLLEYLKKKVVFIVSFSSTFVEHAILVPHVPLFSCL
ncbi:hypothetical protein BC940DRAFT_307446 [Gongronella butleri]|nr:hypothetical protein BC940DRAFT_307446 [Gongronella butleri]